MGVDKQLRSLFHGRLLARDVTPATTPSHQSHIGLAALGYLAHKRRVERLEVGTAVDTGVDGLEYEYHNRRKQQACHKSNQYYIAYYG